MKQPRSTAILLFALVFFLVSAVNGLRLVGSKMGEQQTQKRDASETSPKIYLVGEDFSNWGDDTGTWEIVGDAYVNSENEELLGTKPGSGVVVNGPDGKTLHLFSKAEFGDVRAHIEFMVPRNSNSGVYFMGRYEIQILDSWGVMHPKYSDCGGIYQRWDKNRTPKGYEGHPPRVNASRPPGQWQTYDVIFRAPRFDENGRKIANAKFEKVMHNGIVIHENIELTGPTRASAYNNESYSGPLMLQGDHGPVAYRDIWVASFGSKTTISSTFPFFAMDTGTKDAKHPTAKEQVKMLKELGYAGVDHTGCDGVSQLVGELDKSGLHLFAVYLDVRVDPGQQKYDPKLKETVRLLKGRDTILWLPIRSEKHESSSSDGDPDAVEIIREIADMAAESELRVALYPHYKFWLESVEDAVRVAKKVNRKNVGVTFNLCHWLRVDEERNIKLNLKMAIPYLFLVTINGADHKGGWRELIQTLDSGSFDVYAFLKTLKDLGYAGPIGLQGYGIGGDAYQNLKRSMKAWRKFSERLAAGK